MTKGLLFFSAAFLAVTTMAIPSSAQRSKGIGGALELAFPMGDFSDAADVGFGITGHYQIAWKKKLDLVGQLGFIAWPGPKRFGIDFGWNAIPLQVGIKYFLTQGNSRFYVGGITGFHLFTFKSPVFNPFTGFWEEKSKSDLEFGLAPMGGYQFPASARLLVDFSARFQLVTDDLSCFGLRGGLIYKIR